MFPIPASVLTQCTDIFERYIYLAAIFLVSSEHEDNCGIKLWKKLIR